MRYHCSQCHHHWSVEADAAPAQCPSCKAEAGLEPELATPLPMRAFGLILGGAIVLAVVGTALGFGRGG